MGIQSLQNIRFSDNSKICKRLAYGPDWELYSTDKRSRVLFVEDGLANKWISLHLIGADAFQHIKQDSRNINIIFAPFGSVLEPINANCQLSNVVEAHLFAFSMSETRKLVQDVSFSDAIYVEQYSRILPTWSENCLPDDIILGKWLTGGIEVSAYSFSRLKSTLSWFSQDVLKGIINEAGLSEEKIDLNGEETSKNVVNADAVGQLNQVHISEVFRLPGRKELENFLNNHIVDVVRNYPNYEKLGVEFPSAILLYGPTGSGKTFAVEKFAEFLGWPCFYIDSSTVGSPYIHGTSKKVGDVFAQAFEKSPAIIIIDEMESFLTSRSSNENSISHNEEVGEFLRKIPEARKNRVLIFAMTNMLDLIDSAILRKGRFDHVIKIDLPSRDEVKELLTIKFEKLPVAAEVNVDELAKKLEGRAMSDISFVLREAGRFAGKAEKTAIDNENFKMAIAELPETEKKQRVIGFSTNHQ